MPSFILRKVDALLWDQFKTRAASEGRSLRWVILELIRLYVANGLPVTPKDQERKDDTRGHKWGAP